MANSRFSYVRSYELADNIIPNVYLIVRIDGKGFHKFSDTHNFTKPNDKRALDLMDAAARHVMQEVPDVVVAFGESDEYSFLIKRNSKLYNRRQSKILTLIVSLFTSAYVYNWSRFFSPSPPVLPSISATSATAAASSEPVASASGSGSGSTATPPGSATGTTNETTLKYPPVFDGRVIIYPREEEVQDYFRWRGVDTHINNLYNTTFWALVQQGGQSTTQAHATLKGTFSKDKHEILFTRFGINYNALPAQFRRGSLVVRREVLKSEIEAGAELETGGGGGGGDGEAGIANVDAEGVKAERKFRKSVEDGSGGSVERVEKLGLEASVVAGDDATPSSAVSASTAPPPIAQGTAPAPTSTSTSTSTPTPTQSHTTVPTPSSTSTPSTSKRKTPKPPKPPAPYDGTTGEIVILHEDIVKGDFWERRGWLLR